MFRLIKKIIKPFGYNLSRIKATQETKSKLILIQRELEKIVNQELEDRDLPKEGVWASIHFSLTDKDVDSGQKRRNISLFLDSKLGATNTINLLENKDFYITKNRKV